MVFERLGLTNTSAILQEQLFRKTESYLNYVLLVYSTGILSSKDHNVTTVYFLYERPSIRGKSAPR
jgi:hypothetical protein